MRTRITEQDAQLIEKIKTIVPKLSSSSKDKLLTVVETMAMLHETKEDILETSVIAV